MFGIILGQLASLVVSDNRPRGCLTTMLTGIVGALLGGFVGRITTRQAWTFEFNLASFGVAILGSIARS